MLSNRKKTYERIGILADVALTILAFIAAYFVKKYLLPEPFKGLTSAPNYYTVLFLIVIIWYPLFLYFRTYKISYKTSRFDITYRLIKSVFVGMVILNFFLYVLKITDVSRLLQLIFYVFNFTSLAFYKVVIVSWQGGWHRKDYNRKNILFVGCNKATIGIIREIGVNRTKESKIVGCLTDDDKNECSMRTGFCSPLGKIDALEEILKTHIIDEIVISTPLNSIKNINECLTLCENSGSTISILPDWGEIQSDFQPTIGIQGFNTFCGIPTFSIHLTKRESDAILFKYLIDYVLAVLILLITLPLFLIIPVAIKLSSKGPVFFSQERVGLYGRKFNMYKFRTMVVNADDSKNELEALNESDGPVFKIKKDPRIIPYLGTLLRSTSLDELPQMINVVKGDMSLVGPRPPVMEEVAQYDFWQRRRLSMKPGISCLWQVSPNRNDIPFSDWMRLDLEYIDNWSLGLDLKILVKTIFVILSAQGR